MNCKKFILNILQAITKGVNNQNNESEPEETECIIVNKVSPPPPSPISPFPTTPDIIERSKSKTINDIGHINYNHSYIYDSFNYLYDDFYMLSFDKNLIFYENYKPEKLPLKGWFQKCLKCGTITGQLYNYGDTDTGKLYIRMCERCSNNFDKFPDDSANMDLDYLITKGFKIYKKKVILYK